jgi:ribosomal protein S25
VRLQLFYFLFTSCETKHKLYRVEASIRQDLRVTIRMIADKLNINESMVHRIITQDLNMRKLCTKLVPENLNND